VTEHEDQQYGPPAGHGAAPGYGAPAYGPPAGYGPPAYGPPAGYGPPVATAWPDGPGRPGSATTASVLGFVTGGLTALVTLMFAVFIARGVESDPATTTLILGLPCAAGLIAGAALLMRRRSPSLLFWSALAAVLVLVLSEIVAVVWVGGDGPLGVGVFVLLALPLPVLTAVFASRPKTRGWVAARS
jgi:hypothetical protein